MLCRARWQVRARLPRPACPACPCLARRCPDAGAACRPPCCRGAVRCAAQASGGPGRPLPSRRPGRWSGATTSVKQTATARSRCCRSTPAPSCATPRLRHLRQEGAWPHDGSLSLPHNVHVCKQAVSRSQASLMQSRRLACAGRGSQPCSRLAHSMPPALSGARTAYGTPPCTSAARPAGATPWSAGPAPARRSAGRH